MLVVRPLRRATQIFAALGLFGAVSIAAAQAWPVLDTPRGAIVENLGDQFAIDGRATRIQHVLTSHSAADTVTHYRLALGPQSISHEQGATTTLAARRGAFFITVRVDSDGAATAQAYVMVTPLNAAARSVAPERDLPLPAGSQIINVTDGVDGERRTRTVIALHQVALDAAADAIERALRERGFARISGGAETASSGATSRRRFCLYQRAGAEVFVTVTERHDVGLIVYNFTQED